MIDIEAVNGIGEHPLDILRFWQTCHIEGLRCALVILTDYTGSSSRSLGTHMVVCEDGRFAGSVSSGCLDANIAAEAIGTIKENRRKYVKFGAGSDYVDIKLPCGGGVEFLIEPQPDVHVLNCIIEALTKRHSITVRIDSEQMSIGENSDLANAGARWVDNAFFLRYTPKIRIIVVGRGEELISLVRVAEAAGFPTKSMSPNLQDLTFVEKYGSQTEHLPPSENFTDIEGDLWTAVVLVFHDHDWEPPILKSVLESQAFYIGALGSKKTHQTRISLLREQGVSKEQISRIQGPIGLVPSMRNTSMLAVSTLAEIIGMIPQS